MRQWRGILIQSIDQEPEWAAGTRVPDTPLSTSAPSPLARVPRSPGLEPGSWRPPAPGLTLSNERTFTVWAHAIESAGVYADPLARAQPVTRLRSYTEEGFPEIYLLLRLHRDAAGEDWVQLRLPQRPNGEVGWVRRAAIGSLQANRDLLVLDRRGLRLRFFTDGEPRWDAKVRISDQGTPTPPGHFWIRERFKIFDQRSGYWPYGFGTADYAARNDGPGGGALMIHGSHLEAGGALARPANGCVGVAVRDDAWLGEHLGLGTPLLVI